MSPLLIAAHDRSAAPAVQSGLRVPLAGGDRCDQGGELPTSVARLLVAGAGTTPIVAAFQSSV